MATRRPLVVVSGTTQELPTTDTVPAGALPLVTRPPVALTYAAVLTPDASQGSYQVCTLTGDATLNPLINPTDGQMAHVRFIASAAQRTVTLDTTLQARRLTNVPVSIVIPAGKRGDCLLHYEAADSAAWTVMSFGSQV